MSATKTFAGVIVLLRKAEEALVKRANQLDPNTRVCTLRGIYYGMEWSLDYKIERKRSEAGARIRNAGFLTYTGGNLPADPRPAIGQALFDDLQGSQSIHDAGYGIDVGHLLIGLETRASSNLRTVKFAGQGGTGLEIVTWLGDLGGGVASLARKRVTVPTTSVQVIFNNASSDYGVMDNIEGDVGGYLVACGTAPGGIPAFAPGTGVANALATYAPLASGAQWLTRATRFATVLGANVSPKSGITNQINVVNTLSGKLYEFAIWYAATRWIPSGELIGPSAIKACMHMKGAAREVAEVFVQTLARAIASPRAPIQAAAPYPPPLAAGICESELLKKASVDISAIKKQLDEWRKDLVKLFE